MIINLMEGEENIRWYAPDDYGHYSLLGLMEAFRDEVEWRWHWANLDNLPFMSYGWYLDSEYDN